MIRLLAVTPLHWSSGYDDLLVAVRQVVDRGIDVSLRVEADGPARDRFVYTVADLDLGDRVVLADAGGGDTSTADAVVLAAVEDRPWPELDATMVRADVVVASDLPWTRAHLAASSRTAVLVPPRSAERLADALAELANRDVEGAP